MFDAYANRDNLVCPHPYCIRKGGLCRPHRELVPESMLTESPDYGRITRYFEARIQISALIAARSPQAESESDAAPGYQVPGTAHAAPAVKGSPDTPTPQAGPAAPLPQAICCACKRVYRDGPEPATHGYCEPCLDVELAKVEAS